MYDIEAIKARLEEWERVNQMTIRQAVRDGVYSLHHDLNCTDLGQAVEDLRAVVDMLES